MYFQHLVLLVKNRQNTLFYSLIFINNLQLKNDINLHRYYNIAKELNMEIIKGNATSKLLKLIDKNYKLFKIIVVTDDVKKINLMIWYQK